MDNNSDTAKEALSAAYGLACQQCAKAKCKCVISTQGERCERCHRLDKPCQPSASKRKLKTDNVQTGRVKKASAAADTSRIEQKLDDLASILAANASNPVTQNKIASNNALEYTHITNAEAETSLWLFKIRMLKFFPYVYVPPSMSIQQLRTTKPFLVMCMVTVCAKSASRQRQLLDGVKETLAQKIIVSSEPSIDLLLGLLTILGWMSCLPPPSVENIKLTTSMFARLAASLVSDLGLSQPMYNDPPHLRCFHPLLGSQAKMNQVEPPTMEECRSVLAWFVMLSNLVRSDHPRFTNHMNECLEALEREHESPLDAILVQQVRSSRVVEKANLSVLYHATFEASDEGDLLPTVFMRSMQAELDKLRHDMPIDLQSNVTLRAFHTAAKLQIRCMAIPWPSLASDREPNLAQLQNLTACVDLIQAIFENFFSIPPADFIGISFPIFTQIRLSLGVLFCLSTLDCPGWDKAEVRRHVDPLNMIDGMISAFEKAISVYATENGIEEDDVGALVRVPSHLRQLHSAWAAKMGQSDGEGIAFAPTPQSPDAMAMMPLLDDFLDMNWLMSAM